MPPRAVLWPTPPFLDRGRPVSSQDGSSLESSTTKSLIGDHFILRARSPVAVKRMHAAGQQVHSSGDVAIANCGCGKLSGASVPSVCTISYPSAEPNLPRQIGQRDVDRVGLAVGADAKPQRGHVYVAAPATSRPGRMDQLQFAGGPGRLGGQADGELPRWRYSFSGVKPSPPPCPRHWANQSSPPTGRRTSSRGP